jgi:prepilin-type processing-associated H-X9-DG protein
MVACQANLRSVGQAIAIYVAQNKGVLPPGEWDGRPYLPNGTLADLGAPMRQVRWWTLLQATLNPKYGSTWTDSSTTGADVSRLTEMFQCPDAPGEGNKKSNLMGASKNYQGHPVLMPNINGVMFNGQIYRCYPIAKVKRSSEIGLAWDCALTLDTTEGVWHPASEWSISFDIDFKRWWSTPYLYAEYEKSASPISPDDSIEMTARQTTNAAASDKNGFTNRDVAANASNIRFRHINDTVANVLMVDGHVQSFHYNKKKAADDKNVTDFKRKNLYVNRP